jgi:hypothetical protein
MWNDGVNATRGAEMSAVELRPGAVGADDNASAAAQGARYADMNRRRECIRNA